MSGLGGAVSLITALKPLFETISKLTPVFISWFEKRELKNQKEKVKDFKSKTNGIAARVKAAKTEKEIDKVLEELSDHLSEL